MIDGCPKWLQANSESNDRALSLRLTLFLIITTVSYTGKATCVMIQ
jgi:hypothetical protein